MNKNKPSPNTPSMQLFPVSRKWSARWVWHPHAPAKNAWVLFRRDFDVSDPNNIHLFISADTRYRVWINGHLIGDGPIQSQPYHQYYDQHDISHLVSPGPVCLAVLVQHQGVQDSARGGLLAEVVAGDGRVLCATTGDWRGIVGPWRVDTQFNGMNKIGPYQEHVDLRAIPSGWQQTGFDDSHWPLVKAIDSRTQDLPPIIPPWCRLVPRDIEPLEVKHTNAAKLQCVEECLDLTSRRGTGDLSTSLSQVGRPVEWSGVEHPENLLTPGGLTTLTCSDRHRDGVTDGRYDPCITLDFGRVLTGYAEVEVEAPAGAIIEIGYAERLVDGRFNIALECPFADKATLAQGHNVFRPLIWRSFRYLRLRVKHCEAGLHIRACRAVEVRYPYAYKGRIKGPTRLERIFEISRNTLELCSIESIMDTPYREQAQWLGDVAAVTVPAIYTAFGDTALPGKFIRQAAMNTRPTGLLANISNVASTDWTHDIPDYSLWWVVCLWRHYLYTGDGRYLHECYPEMQRIMRTHLERITPDGVLDAMFGWVFIDWAHIDTRGPCSPYNALFAGACDAAASVARFKGDDWAVNAYTQAADGVRNAFARTFIDPATGLVADAIYEGKLSDLRSEHGNAAAIAFGCVDDATADRIIDRVFDRPSVKTTEAQPFFMVVVLEALRKRGRTDLALRLIDERWGHRMVDRGRTSCTEEWYENGSWRNGDWQGFQRTHSHAWSACPAEFLITGLAGIEILEPGCAKLKVDPYRAEFAYDVTYPTPRGNVHVRWDTKAVSIETPRDIQRG
ncbi:MAG: Bacterial alpha-L-rhamnosidase [Phycisphaera sp.]|nr:Bacterial alpha-L-rhamnosidase [Phycisphaera sp.]